MVRSKTDTSASIIRSFLKTGKKQLCRGGLLNLEETCWDDSGQVYLSSGFQVTISYQADLVCTSFGAKKQACTQTVTPAVYLTRQTSAIPEGCELPISRGKPGTITGHFFVLRARQVNFIPSESRGLYLGGGLSSKNDVESGWSGPGNVSACETRTIPKQFTRGKELLPDLIFIEVGLATLRGLETAQENRAHSRSKMMPSQKIILM